MLTYDLIALRIMALYYFSIYCSPVLKTNRLLVEPALLYVDNQPSEFLQFLDCSRPVMCSRSAILGSTIGRWLQAGITLQNDREIFSDWHPDASVLFDCGFPTNSPFVSAFVPSCFHLIHRRSMTFDGVCGVYELSMRISFGWCCVSISFPVASGKNRGNSHYHCPLLRILPTNLSVPD